MRNALTTTMMYSSEGTPRDCSTDNCRRRTEGVRTSTATSCLQQPRPKPTPLRAVGYLASGVTIHVYAGNTRRNKYIRTTSWRSSVSLHLRNDDMMRRVTPLQGRACRCRDFQLLEGRESR